MPAKRWYLQQRGEEIIVIYDGEEMKRAGKPVGRIKTMNAGGQEPKAKAYKDQAILIKFMTEKVLFNRAHFEWNKSDLSQKFRNATSAASFLKVWQNVTEMGDLGFATCRVDENVASAALNTSSSSTEAQTEGPSSIHPTDIQPPLPKRPRISKSTSSNQNPIDLSIESKRVGLLQVPLRNTTEPPQCRLLRRVDPVFVESLVSKIAADPLGPGVPPLALVCTSIDVKANFKEELREVYKYEVHGGTHGRAARLALLSQNPDNKAYTHILADVFVGLTDAECLRLAARHNINGHFHHEMTHRDYLEACRSRLFTISEKDVSKDPTPIPTATWKKSCIECILPPDMSRTTRENVFCQASFARPVWDLAVEVMDMFEEGKLKQQKLSQKNLIATPEFKQQHFLPLHHLEESFQVQMLQQVVNREYSLSDVKEACSSYRAMATIKKAFVRCTNTANWEEAEDRFGAHANEGRLAQFRQLSFQKQIPGPFLDYCQSALNSESSTTVDCFTVFKDDAKGYVLPASPTTLTAARIKTAVSSYTGAHLIIAHIPQDWSAEKMENLAYTTRQLNSVSTSLMLYNFAVLCETEQMSMVEASLLKCYDHTSTVFAHNESAPLSSGVGLVPSMCAIIIGHWSQSAEMCSEHFAARAHNFLQYKSMDDNIPPTTAATHTSLELMKGLIGLLSFEGQLVLDLMSATGSGVLAALSMKRNCIAVEEDSELLGHIKRRLLKEYKERSSSPEIPLQK